MPVAKGNGYGFAIGRLARRVQWLHEHAGHRHPVDHDGRRHLPRAARGRPRFAGDLLVLTPWRPSAVPSRSPRPTGHRVVHTVSRLEDLRALPDDDPRARFVLERLTSMRRHGMTRRELAEAGQLLAERRLTGLRGVALHLPLNVASHLGEVTRLVNDVVAAGLDTRTVFVSHLTRAELAACARRTPTSPSARGSAPTSGSATAARCR